MMFAKAVLLMAVGLAADPVGETENNAEATTAAAEFTLTGAEHNVLQLTNEERAKRGLPALTIDESLVESARKHCQWMASRRSLQHTSQPVGENIAMGQSDSAQAVRTWMNSSGHRANILGRSWNRVGAAAFTSPEGRIYWCMQFLR